MRLICRTEYSVNLEPGGKLLRPWQLGYRTDFGLPGQCDPFDTVNLIELVLSQGPLSSLYRRRACVVMCCDVPVLTH